MGWPRVGVGFGWLVGAGVAVQGRVNGALGERLHDGIAAAAVSFVLGLGLLGVVFAVSGRLRAGVRLVWVAVRDGTLRWWHLLGGLCGAFFVACQGLTVAVVGVTAFTVAVVAGQLTSSVLVDRLGLGPGGRTPVTAMRLGGAGLALVAVVISALGRTDRTDSPDDSLLHGIPAALLIVLPALSGMSLAWQQAMNGRVGAVGGPLSATLMNFLGGTVALIAVESPVVAAQGLPTRPPTEPWLYLGGLLGVTFIALAALVVRRIGVLLLGLASVAGQLSTALVLDLVFPSGSGLPVAAVLGCALTLVAVLVAARRPASQ
ncbi:DMT family transporter [Nocardia terpenica]|uniref:EamA-like transporter family protein n=1 Tax=Nocardia terpenica TaxID=455432 RepID=A0A291RC04_9NOCA|nr:DMT family transporter [Nocardia terpenica]ATL64963.1 hypothetical protein CRH09_00645 [Nocardia terpenica]